MVKPIVGVAAAAFAVVMASAPTTAAVAAPAAPPAVTPAPVFDCAADDGNGVTEYFFSYTYPGSAETTIPVGDDNHVAPGDDVGQPTIFEPGTHSAFSVATHASSATWFLAGHSATGSAANLCTTAPVVAEAGTWLVLPAATAGPLLAWFGWHVRRQRRAARDATTGND